MNTTWGYERKWSYWSITEWVYVGLIKESIRKDLKEKDSPLVFWDYYAERRQLINNLTAKNLIQLDGTNPNFKITGDEGDISNLCQFGWFDCCYYRDSSAFPYQEEKLGRVLGPAKNHSTVGGWWWLLLYHINIKSLTTDVLGNVLSRIYYKNCNIKGRILTRRGFNYFLFVCDNVITIQIISYDVDDDFNNN